MLISLFYQLNGESLLKYNISRDVDGWWADYKYSSCSAKIYYQPCPHFNGHWKIRASFNPNLGSGTSSESTFKLESLRLISRLWHWRVNFPFPASPLHLSTPSISWCSEYFLMHRLSPATRGPVVRGNTRHRFSMYPHQPPPCQYAFLWKRIPRLKVLS